MQGFETHRCEAMPYGTSIRGYGKIDGWRLGFLDSDTEYDYVWLHQIARISYCPWCGKRLD